MIEEITEWVLWIHFTAIFFLWAITEKNLKSTLSNREVAHDWRVYASKQSIINSLIEWGPWWICFVYLCDTAEISSLGQTLRHCWVLS